MKLIITAGGTSERIDDVRSITNTSTGRLGYAIGQRFLETPVETIYYLHGLRATPLEGSNVKAIPVEGAMDLKEKMESLLKEEEIDAVVHAMAVSDFMVKAVTTLERIQSGEQEGLSGNKISSDIDNLTIVMERSPKVIGMIKELSPDTILTGFKLLSHVPHEELIQTGYSLLQKNQCDFVLANDLAEIGGDAHRGYLIHKDGSYDTMENNRQIAGMIVKRVWEAYQ